MEMTEKEKLAWLAGFFDGDGSMSMQPRGQNKRSICGELCFGNSCRELLETVERYLLELGFLTEDIRYYGYHYAGSRSHPSVRLFNTGGAKLLKMLLPYLQHPKQQARAKIFIEAFDGLQKGVRSKRGIEQKHVAYEKWCELKIKELQEV